MKYKIIDNFIDENFCSKLVSNSKELENQIFNENIIHGGRNFISSTSDDFSKLQYSSESWDSFSKYLESREFAEFIFSKLGMKINSFEIVNLYKAKNSFSFIKEKKKFNSKKINLLSSKRILWFIFMRFLHRAYLNLKLSRFFFTKKNPIELLYDFSIAQNGYSLPIHRDTDARIVIFLIYLNDVSEGSEGGNFNIYKLKTTKNFFPPSPNLSDCNLIKSITPKAGRAIFLDGSMDSYHSVDKMINHKNRRYFIYGSFTSLLNKNNLIDYNKTNKFNTEFNLYE
ncbi:MAG: hypothetical protein CMD58_06400 [Gammaproteobacteria bacterium]|nr:hypothetical protein [Gammaproteobacteria bacterium]